MDLGQELEAGLAHFGRWMAQFHRREMRKFGWITQICGAGVQCRALQIIHLQIHRDLGRGAHEAKKLVQPCL